MHLRIIGVLVSTLLLPGLAMAEFKYTNIEVNFIDVDFDAGPASVDGDGYRFSGMYLMNPNAFLHGKYEDHDYGFGIDGSVIEFGAGYRHGLSSTLDLIATASYVNAELGVGGLGSVDDDGLGLGGGVRAQVGSSFQVEALLSYVNMDNGGSDTGVDLLGRYYFNDRYAVSVATSFDDNVDTFSVGFRAEF